MSDAMLFSSWMMFFILLITHAQQACAEWKEEMTSGMSSLWYCLHCIFTIHKRKVWGKVIFSQACVKNSIHRRGVSAFGPRVVSASGLGGVWQTSMADNPEQTSPLANTSPLGRHLLDRHPSRALRETVNKRAVHILLECILVEETFSVADLEFSRED